LRDSLKRFDLLFSTLADTLFASYKTHCNYAGDVFEAAISPQEAESCCLAIADTGNVYKHMERHNFKPWIQSKCEELTFFVMAPLCNWKSQM